MESCTSHRHKNSFCSLSLIGLAGGLVLAVLLWTSGPASGREPATGRLKVVMGRTPVPSRPVKEATVTVTRVEVLQSRRISERVALAASMSEVGPIATAEDAWVTVYQGEQILNLLELRDGRADLLINADIPEGRYTRLRLTCAQGRITIGDSQENAADRTFIVKPQQPGAAEVTLDYDFVVASGRETGLLLDVDVDLAFQPSWPDENGEPARTRGFVFRPASAMRLSTLLSGSPSDRTSPAKAENRRR